MNRQQLDSLADLVLARIRRRPEHRYALKDLGKQFKADPVDLLLSLKIITDWGYRLKTTRDYVAFLSAPDLLTATEISYGLKTKRIGRIAVSHRSVKSTNDIASQMADSGAEHGTIVTAEEQTKGRGRLGRQWYSPEGSGIYVSMILRPSFPPEKAPAISIVTALALADTVTHWVPRDVKIKWPNDILIKRRKIAGILTELSAERNKINHIVVGVGINANQPSGTFPQELKTVATSIRRVMRRKINRVEFLQRFLYRFEKEYELYAKSGLKKSQRRIRTYSSLIGNTITVTVGNDRVSGRAVDIDAEGRLIMEHDGATTAITAGEVSVVKK